MSRGAVCHRKAAAHQSTQHQAWPACDGLLTKQAPPHLDKVQVLGDDVLAVVHDEHAADVQLDVVQLLAGVEHVEWGTLRHVQDGPARQAAGAGKNEGR